jgi:type VI protein secretion system component VasF
MKRINFRSWSPTYPKYGEHYRIWERIAVWFSLSVLVFCGVFLCTQTDWRMLFVGAGTAYIALAVFTFLTIHILQRRIKELQAQLSATTQKEGK